MEKNPSDATAAYEYFNNTIITYNNMIYNYVARRSAQCPGYERA